jgi:hypothetical protein
MKEREQETWTGVGWVVYWRREERGRGNEGMGKSAEVYDAVMLALLRGLEAAIAFQQNTSETSRRQPTIILFANNTSAVEAITKGKPGPSKELAQNFVETATLFLEENRGAEIEVTWVPGHRE